MTHSVRFTFRDLIVLLMIAPLVLTAALAAEEAGDDDARRIRCARNLKQIGLAMQIYANENKGAFPRTLYDAKNPESVTAFSNPKTPARRAFSAEEGVEPNDVTAPMYLVLTTGDITSELFICPSTKNERLTYGGDENDFAGDVQDTSNFPSLKNLSYSYANPYPSEEARKKGFKFNFALPAEFAIVSDLNPGGEAVMKRNGGSPNHNGEGQNVLYADGHVDFTTTPFCGMKREDNEPDNIFTRHLGDGAAEDADPIMGPAMDQFDSVMLPSADVKERVEKLRKTRPRAGGAAPAAGGTTTKKPKEKAPEGL